MPALFLMMLSCEFMSLIINGEVRALRNDRLILLEPIKGQEEFWLSFDLIQSP